MVTQKFWS